MENLTLVSVFIKSSKCDPVNYRLKDENNNIIELSRDDIYNRLNQGEYIANIEIKDGKLKISDKVYQFGYSKNKEMSIENTLDVLGISHHWAKDLHLIDPYEVGLRCKTEIPFRCENGHVYISSAFKMSYLNKMECPHCRKLRLEQEAKEKEQAKIEREQRKLEKEQVKIEREQIKAEEQETSIQEIYNEKNANFAFHDLMRADNNNFDINDVIKHPKKYKQDIFNFKCELGHVETFKLYERVKLSNRIIKRCKKCIEIRDNIIDIVLVNWISDYTGVSTTDIQLDKFLKNDDGYQKFRFVIPKLNLIVHTLTGRAMHGIKSELRADIAKSNSFSLIEISRGEALADLFAVHDFSALDGIKYKLEIMINELEDKLVQLSFKGSTEKSLNDYITEAAKNIESGIFVENLTYNKCNKIDEQDNTDKQETLDNKGFESENIEDNSLSDVKEDNKKEELTPENDKSTEDINNGQRKEAENLNNKTVENKGDTLDKVGVLKANKTGCKLKLLSDITNKDKFTGVIIGDYEIKCETLPVLMLKLAYFIYMTDFIKFAHIVEDRLLRYEYYDREFRIVSTKHYDIRNVSNIPNTCVYVDATLGVTKNIKYIKRMLEVANLTDKAFLKLVDV